MAEVLIDIGGRRHPVQCRDGEEDALRRLAAMLDARWEAAQRAAGNVGGERALLFVALLLADDLAEAEQRVREGSAAGDPNMLAGIAERLEALADTLEHGQANA